MWHLRGILVSGTHMAITLEIKVAVTCLLMEGVVVMKGLIVDTFNLGRKQQSLGIYPGDVLAMTGPLVMTL